MSFVLRKWYLDVTTADGSYLIVYLGQLAFKSLSVGFGHCLGNGRFSSLSSPPKLRSHCDPEVDCSGKITVNDPDLNLSADWTPEAAPARHTLLTTAKGQVEWCCVQPSARVSVRHDDMLHTGHGYIECLTMTIPPWDLGLSKLHWGRYVSNTDHLTWVRWTGTHPLELAIVNGETSRRVDIIGNRVATEGYGLDLRNEEVIRDGMLGSTVLRKLPDILPFTPLQILRLHERKWLARGRLATPEGMDGGGWSIHEDVTWPAPAQQH